MKQWQLGYEKVFWDVGFEYCVEMVKLFFLFEYELEMKEVIWSMLYGLWAVDGLVFMIYYLVVLGFRVLKVLGVEVFGEVVLISFDEFGVFDLVELFIIVNQQFVEDIGCFVVEILVYEIVCKGVGMDKQWVFFIQFFVCKFCGV